MPRYVDFTPDKKLQLADGTVAITTGQDAFLDTTVAGATPIFDVGSAAADLRVVVDVTSCSLNSDNVYSLHVYGSNDATMTSGLVLLGTLVLGHSTLIGTGSHRGVGRHSFTCSNIGSNSPASYAAQVLTPQRYVKAAIYASGLSGSINFQAWITAAK